MKLFSKTTGVAALALVVAAGAGAGYMMTRAPDVAGGPAVMRRLTQDQYRTIVKDVFGSSLTIAGRFEPDNRANHLVAVGAGQASVTASGLEQYDRMAKGLAAQVVDPDHRAQLIPCKPADEKAPDDACAGQFLGKVGRLLYRRPLADGELKGLVAATHDATVKVGDFYGGLKLALAGLLESPQFLYRHEYTEADPDHKGGYRLDAYSKAARLSFLLWNSAPDAELLAAAEKGELHTEKGLTRQVDRMLASPRLESGLRAFFTDMLEFDTFDTLSKDATLYPKYTAASAEDAREQTLRTIIDLVLTQKGDYRDLFTTRKTFLTPLLGSLYRIPVEAPNGMPHEWVGYEYPKGSAQAGILTQVSFMALHSHPGRSSPTLRGKALREVLLCQKVPDPPGNVNFNIVQDTANPNYKTVRQRLTAHATDATCVGCHKITDPVGLAMENFDTIGGFRQDENGAAIDVKGELDGIAFDTPEGLGKAVHDHPETPACIVNRVYAYGTGRNPTKGESEWLRGYVLSRFASDGYRIPDLLRRIATSETFYRVQEPEAQAKPATVASADINGRTAEAGK